MLTVDTLKQNSALAGLTDEQFLAIAEMSKNDENSVIGTKIGALHGQYDKDIFEVTGIKKNDGEKSYDYTKRVLTEYKAKASKVESLNTEITDLKAKLEAGLGDETLRRQLKDSQTQVQQLQSKLSDSAKSLKDKEADFNAKLKAVQVDYAFKEATAGLKFKSDITEPIQKTLLNAAKAEVLTRGVPDFVEDGTGNKVLVLRDTNGVILNNPKNGLNPYTLKELIMETALKDVLSTGNTAAGGGTKPVVLSNTDTSSPLDLTGIKTQLEADKAIENYLLASGITRDSIEFGEKLTAIRNENEVSNLPIR